MYTLLATTKILTLTQGRIEDFELGAKVQVKKIMKYQISIYLVLTNYQ